MKTLYRSDKHWLFIVRGDDRVAVVYHGTEEIARGSLDSESEMYRVKHLYNGLVNLHNTTGNDHRRGLSGNFVLEAD